MYTAGRDTVIKVWNPKDGGMLKLGLTSLLVVETQNYDMLQP